MPIAAKCPGIAMKSGEDRAQIVGGSKVLMK